MSYQSITIVGNVGRDPEMRYTPTGKAVTNFSVAVNERRGEEDVATWFKVTCWNGLAETVNLYLTKGRQVLVEGRISVESWTGRDGKPQSTLTITANTVRFLGRATANGNAGHTEADAADEEIPI